MSLSLLDNSRSFWEKFEASIFEILDLAIINLNAQKSFPEDEDELNRLFYNCLCEANYTLQKKNRGQASPPVYEALCQPAGLHITKQSRENKRPDFQWPITDITELDFRSSSKQFVLECKRLSEKTGSWDFANNYVNHGVLRFIDDQHGYGFNVQSSAMLGYIQKLTVEFYENSINSRLKEISQNQMVEQGSDSNRLRYQHQLSTSHSLGTMLLVHLWADLRTKKNN